MAEIKWNTISSGKPKVNDVYIVTIAHPTGYRYTYMAFWNGDMWTISQKNDDITDKVVAWADLPDAYTEKKDA